jgi:hypothetical protein
VKGAQDLLKFLARRTLLQRSRRLTNEAGTKNFVDDDLRHKIAPAYTFKAYKYPHLGTSIHLIQGRRIKP